MISEDTLRARLAGLDPAADLEAPDVLGRVDLETPDEPPRRHWGRPLILAAAAVALVGLFGATVVLADEDTGKEVTYKIVGGDESDIKVFKISIGSPLARALIGKKAGDEVTVNAPKGNIHYEVVKVSYE